MWFNCVINRIMKWQKYFLTTRSSLSDETRFVLAPTKLEIFIPKKIGWLFLQDRVTKCYGISERSDKVQWNILIRPMKSAVVAAEWLDIEKSYRSFRQTVKTARIIRSPEANSFDEEFGYEQFANSDFRF